MTSTNPGFVQIDGACAHIVISGITITDGDLLTKGSKPVNVAHGYAHQIHSTLRRIFGDDCAGTALYHGRTECAPDVWYGAVLIISDDGRRVQISMEGIEPAAIEKWLTGRVVIMDDETADAEVQE